MKKGGKKISFFRLFLIIIIIILAVAAVALGVFYYSGKKSLLNKVQQVPNLGMNKSESGEDGQETEAEDTAEKKDEVSITYKGKKYRYRDNAFNILFIGVDSSGTEEDSKVQGAGNGQADMIVLANLNLDDKKISLIPINRDTMTKISVMDKDGNFVRNETAQIALSYAYGKDNEQSAELTKQAVSNMLYGIPIHGYYEMNIDGITVVNNAIGGVDLVLQEDYVKEWGDRFMKGATVHLEGKMAEVYIRRRYGKSGGSNASRMERQKSYLLAMIKKIMVESLKNPQLPMQLQEELKDYSHTDLGTNEFSFLAAQVIQCGFSEDGLMKIEGDSVKGDLYQEFYADESKLYDLIINVFYEEVKE